MGAVTSALTSFGSETGVSTEALLPNKIWIEPELCAAVSRPAIKLSIKS